MKNGRTHLDSGISQMNLSTPTGTKLPTGMACRQKDAKELQNFSAAKRSEITYSYIIDI